MERYRKIMASKKTLVGLQAVDIISTTIGNNMFGVEKYESNPLGVFAYEHGGIWGLLAFKAVTLSMILPALLLTEKMEERQKGDAPISKKFVTAANYLYSFIGITNILPLLTHDLSTP